MSTTPPSPDPASTPTLFAPRPTTPRDPSDPTAPTAPTDRPWLPWAVAAGIVLLAAILVFALTSRGAPAPGTVRPLAAYAPSLVFSGLQMSESTSLSGGKSTFIDGKVTNTGSATVTSATLQVLFANDAAMPPQVETVPLTVIRMRDPYIDTQAVSPAAPLAPGQQQEFRLIFENISPSWNQTLPEIHPVSIQTR